MSQHLRQDDSDLEILPSAIPVYDPRTRISSRGPKSHIDERYAVNCLQTQDFPDATKQQSVKESEDSRMNVQAMGAIIIIK